MKTSTKVVLGLIVIAVAIFAVTKFTGQASAEPSIYDGFAQCVTDAGAAMYGAYWCPHCDNQKKMFGSGFDYINYIECDPRGDNAQPQLCDANGITGYPTWIFADGTRRSGELPLRTLASITGCELPQ